MRARSVFVSGLLLAGVTAGCFSFRSSAEDFLQGDGGTSGTGGTGGTGGTTTTTTDTTPEPGCIPNMGDAPVGDDCGVFISASKGDDATGDGTKDKPYATPSKAAEVAAGKPIYMCAEAFAGPFEIKNSALIYGGLDCATDWKYVGLMTLTDISADADQVPLRIAADTVVELQDTRVVAADATVKGGSSIAIFVDSGATFNFVRGTAEAGNGAVGQEGGSFSTGAADGQKGADGGDACSAGTVVTPDPPTSGCGDPESAGGLGGIGASVQGGDGTAGVPQALANGGKGESASVCSNGTVGKVGDPGMAGTGAVGVGTLDASKGYVGVSGSDGIAGMPGQGGGGGGGAKGGTGAGKCPSGMAGGASGGSGGSGGCGGLGGKGGGPGGSSMAIASLGKALKLDSVKLIAKTGGAGGEGGQGQTGGLQAAGGAGGKVAMGLSLNPGCPGGPGGSGGDGGKGGGGLGGHSIGIAHSGSTSIDGTPDVTVDKAGDGGLGDGATGNGAPGTAKDIQEL